MNFLVSKAPVILDTLYKFSITRIPTNWILKHTMFRHFCGGESLKPDVIATMRRLKVYYLSLTKE
jgi:hypothetical protein